MKKHICIALGHREQGGEGQREGGSGWMEGGKGREMGDIYNSVNNKHKVKNQPLKC